MIDIQHLNFGYDRRLILQDVSVIIPKNGFISIIGPNGGGKTTFLNLIAGFLSPLAGEVLIENHPAEEFKAHIGYVPQINRFDQDFPITALEVVLSGLIKKLPWHGQFTKKLKNQALRALHELDLHHIENTPFGDLSGGQAQRVLIARALVDSPKILILDEPTANVDKETKKTIFDLLTKLKGSMTILFVTHETPGLIPISDLVLCVQKRVTLMDKKQICSHFNLGVYHEL